MKTKTKVAKQNIGKKKKRDVLSLYLFYYYFSWRRGFGLLSCSLWGPLICPLGVTLGRNWEACQENLHSGILFIFGGVLENSRGHVGIKGSLLVCLNFFFTSLRLLGQFWRTARKGWDLVGVFFLQNLPLREGRLFWNYPKKGRGWLGGSRFFCLPKHRRRLNPSLVEGFIPYLGIVNPTHP